ncbi:MAG: hypothetical protein FGM32_06650 [Candidatus Kapabacteria bacterium]|nr:hypothetical protein [Candidatus Kapabacteria bacterium]
MRAILSILSFFLLMGSVPAMAQDAEPEPIILTEIVSASAGKVYRAVEKSMAEVGCPKPQAFTRPDETLDDGLLKGKWVSEYCMLQEGTDSVKAYIKKYSELPRIRGGIWTTCRVQYTFNIKEVEEGKSKIILRAQMSGYEEFITQSTHFWPSNGILERAMMARLLANISASNK